MLVGICIISHWEHCSDFPNHLTPPYHTAAGWSYLPDNAEQTHGCQDWILTMVLNVHRPCHSNSCSIFCHIFLFMCQQLVVSLANYCYLMHYVVLYPGVFLHWTKNAHTFYLLSSLASFEHFKNLLGKICNYSVLPDITIRLTPKF